MYEVAFAETMGHLKRLHLVRVLRRLFGSKVGKHRVKTLSGKAKKSLPQNTGERPPDKSGFGAGERYGIQYRKHLQGAARCNRIVGDCPTADFCGGRSELCRKTMAFIPIKTV